MGDGLKILVSLAAERLRSAAVLAESAVVARIRILQVHHKMLSISCWVGQCSKLLQAFNPREPEREIQETDAARTRLHNTNSAKQLLQPCGYCLTRYNKHKALINSAKSFPVTSLLQHLHPKAPNPSEFIHTCPRNVVS